MNTKQKYVGGDSHATTPAQGGPSYRRKIYLLVSRIARDSDQAESVIWHSVYGRLESHHGVYLAAYPRRHKESLLRVAERYDLLDKIYQCAQAEKQLLDW